MKNQILAITLFVLLCLTAGVIWLQQNEVRPVADPQLFRVADASLIDHIQLVTSAGAVDLKYTGSQWRVNEKYEADPQLIKVLMATLLQVVPKRPVALQQRDTVARRLADKGTKVSIYEGSTLVKQFQSGGNLAKTEAWFSDGTTGQAYLITIPGYRVYASGIFELNENEWRDKRIFNFNWRNFRRLTMKYPGDPSAGFEIERQKDFLGVVGINKPDSSRINSFLSDVLSLAADQIIPAGSNPHMDSVVQSQPALILTIEDIANRNYRLELFNLKSKDQRVTARALDNEIVTLERRKTFTILKRKDYFGK